MSTNKVNEKFSNKNIIPREKNRSEESLETFVSYKKFGNCSGFRIQQNISVNISPIQCHIDVPLVRSKSIMFRLNNPVSSTVSTDKCNRIFKTEIYYNQMLEEKINELQPQLHVNLSYCHLNDTDVSVIVNRVVVDRKCTELWLHGNQITSQGATTLASSLVHNTTLNSLDLSYNKISDMGTYVISQALLPFRNWTLQTLQLSKNGISNDGIDYLSEMLKTNITLKELWLSENEFGSKGVQKLAHTLAYDNKTLKCLSLSTNIFITDSCINDLIEMLQHNHTLKHIWIEDCSLTERGKNTLRDVANRKTHFKIEL